MDLLAFVQIYLQLFVNGLYFCYSFLTLCTYHFLPHSLSLYHPACCKLQVAFHLPGQYRKGKQLKQVFHLLKLNQAMAIHLPKQNISIEGATTERWGENASADQLLRNGKYAAFCDFFFPAFQDVHNDTFRSSPNFQFCQRSSDLISLGALTSMVL